MFLLDGINDSFRFAGCSGTEVDAAWVMSGQSLYDAGTNTGITWRPSAQAIAVAKAFLTTSHQNNLLSPQIWYVSIGLEIFLDGHGESDLTSSPKLN